MTMIGARYIPTVIRAVNIMIPNIVPSTMRGIAGGLVVITTGSGLLAVYFGV